MAPLHVLVVVMVHDGVAVCVLKGKRDQGRRRRCQGRCRIDRPGSDGA